MLMEKIEHAAEQLHPLVAARETLIDATDAFDDLGQDLEDAALTMTYLLAPNEAFADDRRAFRSIRRLIELLAAEARANSTRMNEAARTAG